MPRFSRKRGKKRWPPVCSAPLPLLIYNGRPGQFRSTTRSTDFTCPSVRALYEPLFLHPFLAHTHTLSPSRSFTHTQRAKPMGLVFRSLLLLLRVRARALGGPVAALCFSGWMTKKWVTKPTRPPSADAATQVSVQKGVRKQWGIGVSFHTPTHRTYQRVPHVTYHQTRARDACSFSLPKRSRRRLQHSDGE